jgi:hypothetical protein
MFLLHLLFLITSSAAHSFSILPYNKMNTGISKNKPYLPKFYLENINISPWFLAKKPSYSLCYFFQKPSPLG